MPELSPDEVAAHAFSTSFRGFDPSEVRTFLARVAERLREAEAKAQELSTRLTEAEDRASHPEMDVETLTGLLGEETARILRSAQDAAADIRGKAEENVAHLLREAYEEAARIRADAELVLARETEAAEAAAAEIRSGAEADAAAALARARHEAERLLEDVESRARAMVEEAQASRTKILTDLARRRKLAHTQVEQLRAGRERLLEAYRLVRSTLDEVTDELVRAEAEARAAAEAAARRLTDEPVEGDALDIAAEPELEPAPEPDATPAADAAIAPTSEPPPGSEPSAKEATAVVHAPTAEASQAGLPEEPAPHPQPEPPRVPRVAVAPPLPEPDERRLSSLRIIRRPKAEAEAEVEAAPEAAPDPEPEPEPTAKPEGTAEPAPRRPEPAPAPESVAGFTPVAPATAGEGIRLIKPSPPVPEPPLPEEVGEAPVGAEDEPVPQPAAEAPPAPDEAPDPAPASVDDLFARIRADREQEVAKAREVLKEPEPAEVEPTSGAVPTSDPEPESAPEAETEAPTDDADEALLQRRDRVVEDIEHRLARRLKRVLQDEQNDVLDRFRSTKGKATAEAVLLSPEQHPERYRGVAAELLYEAARAGTAFVGDLDTAVSVDDLADSLAADLVTPLRRRLERAFEEGADEEAALMVERIGAAYRENKGKRIEQLAADHVVAAFSRGTFLATSEGSPLRWIVDDVGGPCPDCDDNALAGPTPRGEEYPTGRLHPPAHAGCRCLLAPVAP